MMTERTRLQRAAFRNIVRHWWRNVTRISVLIAGDLAMLLGLRAGMQWFVGAVSLPAPLAETLGLLAPQGVLGGWLFAVVLVGALSAAGAYGAGDRRRDASRLFVAAGLAAGLLLYGGLRGEGALVVALYLLAVTPIVGLGLTLDRLVVDSLVDRYRARVGGRRVITVSGGPADWIDPGLAVGLKGGPPSLRVVGTVSTLNGDGNNGYGPLRSLGQVIEQSQADTVLVCGPLSDEEFGFVIDTALVSGCLLLSASRTARIGAMGPRGVWIDGVPMVELTAPSLQAWQLAIKRGMDVVLASVGLMLLAPVFAVLAPLIRLDSPGPVFFRQWRVGRAGKPFRIYKFRSMAVGAEERLDELRGQSVYRDPRLFKMPDDPRMTRVGRWLRRTSLDEFPQLINVLRGEMALVGPRPPLPSEVDTYEEHHYCRFDVQPGITGPWQISGRNTVRDFEEVMRLESDYIRNWSLLADLRILLKTLPVVLRMDGAH